MKVTKVSQLTGDKNTLELDVTIEQLERFENRKETGEYVQTIFPHLSKGEREFLLTGVTPTEWIETFGSLDK
jgi:hypothetical protein